MADTEARWIKLILLNCVEARLEQENKRKNYKTEQSLLAHKGIMAEILQTRKNSCITMYQGLL